MAEFLRMGPDLLDSYVQTATHAIIYSQGEIRERSLEKLRSGVGHYCELEEKLKHIQEIAQRYADTVIDNEEDMKKIITEYSDTVNSEFEVNLAENKHVKHFNQQIKALIQNVGGGSNEEANVNETDDDLLVTQGDINVICPITKVRMVEPMRNTRCGHVYDKNAISAMIDCNKRTKCPVVGCNNQEFLRMEDMQPDMVTRAVIDRMAS